MDSSPPNRQTILEALREALEPLPYIQAMWEGGAAAFGRVDQWSDIDLQVAADDDRVADVIAVIDEILELIGPIDVRYEIPQPSFHGFPQVFYRLCNTSPYLLIDFVVMGASTTNRFLEPEIHGKALVHFDKTGFTRLPPIDPALWATRLQDRMATLRVSFDLFKVLVHKELQRGNSLEALAFYQGFSLKPLVEALRIRYSPYHYNFHTRYLQYELPAEIVARLEKLFFVTGSEDLARKQAVVEEWFQELNSAS